MNDQTPTTTNAGIAGQLSRWCSDRWAAFLNVVAPKTCADPKHGAEPRRRFRGLIPLLAVLLLGGCTFPWSSTQDRLTEAAASWSADCAFVQGKAADIGVQTIQCTANTFGDAAARIMGGTSAPSGAFEPRVQSPATEGQTNGNSGASAGSQGVIKIYQ